MVKVVDSFLVTMAAALTSSSSECFPIGPSAVPHISEVHFGVSWDNQLFCWEFSQKITLFSASLSLATATCNNYLPILMTASMALVPVPRT